MSKKYLILGASSDVGIALIECLNNNESNIQIIAHYNTSKERIDSIPICSGNELIAIQCDLSDGKAVEDMITVINEVGIPDGIVHLAAPKLEYSKFKDTEWEDCLADIKIQVESVYVVLKSLLPQMVKNKIKAKVVLMLSENTVIMPAKFTTKYTLSKYMLLGLVKSLSAEYAGKNVNINGLSPSMIDTKLLSNIDRRLLEMSGITEKMLKPEEVALYLVKLLSSESDNMYGENIYIPRR